MVFLGLAHRNNASMGYFAFGVFELDRGVDHAEIVVQDFFNVAQDAFARGRRNVGNGDVAGEGMTLRSDAPDVQIVHIVHSPDRTDR